MPSFRRVVLMLAAAPAAMLAACADLPPDTVHPEPRPSSAWYSDASFAGVSAEWPEEAWWRAWGDPALDALETEALAGSPDMAAAIARVARAAADVRVAGAADTPKVTVNAELPKELQSNDYLMPPGATPQGWRSYPQATANLSWDLDLWGKNRAALVVAAGEAAAVKSDAAQARIVLAAAVASSWAELSRLETMHDDAARTEALRERGASIARLRREAGLDTEAQTRRAEGVLAEARRDLAAIGEQVALQRNAIAALLGAGPDRGVALPHPHLALARPPGLPSKLALGLLGRRPDVVAARLRVEAAGARIEGGKSAFYPDVNIAAFIGLQSLGLATFAHGNSLFGSVGPALTLPIFDGGELRGRLEGDHADRDAAVAEYDRTLNRAIREVADATLSRRALAEQLVQAGETAQAASDARDEQSRRRTEGIIGEPELLAAEVEAVSARRSMNDLGFRAWALDAALCRALGGGWQEQSAR